MKLFVERVHELGMKIMLWYALPFMGKSAENFRKFEGMYLRYWKEQGTYIMDPRDEHVRQFIFETYSTAIKNWDLDGFKLDFLGMWHIDCLEEKKFLSEAIQSLFVDLFHHLISEKPEIMIEFRQPYIGPKMRHFGQMFRCCDCPNMASINRVRSVDLRLLSNPKYTVIHSDMVMWNSSDSVENAALQLLNILFTVPQISVCLLQLPQKHIEMLRFWLKYWRSNRHILLDGHFVPSSPLGMYSVIKTVGRSKMIVLVYESNTVVSVTEAEVSKLRKIDIVNAKGDSEIIIRVVEAEGEEKREKERERKKGVERYEVEDCRGAPLSSFRYPFPLALLPYSPLSFSIPPSAILHFYLSPLSPPS